MMNTREYSSKQESRIAKIFEGKVVPNSGATKFKKGDVVVKNKILIECKTSTTEKTSFSIKKEWLEKIKEEAFEVGVNYSALAIDFGSNKDYFIIDSHLMKILVNTIKEKL